jgi:hypothetical protein
VAAQLAAPQEGFNSVSKYVSMMSLTSPTSGSVDIARMRTKAMKFFFSLLQCHYIVCHVSEFLFFHFLKQLRNFQGSWG